MKYFRTCQSAERILETSHPPRDNKPLTTNYPDREDEKRLSSLPLVLRDFGQKETTSQPTEDSELQSAFDNARNKDDIVTRNAGMESAALGQRGRGLAAASVQQRPESIYENVPRHAQFSRIETGHMQNAGEIDDGGCKGDAESRHCVLPLSALPTDQKISTPSSCAGGAAHSSSSWENVNKNNSRPASATAARQLGPGPTPASCEAAAGTTTGGGEAAAAVWRVARNFAANESASSQVVLRPTCGDKQAAAFPPRETMNMPGVASRLEKFSSDRMEKSKAGLGQAERSTADSDKTTDSVGQFVTSQEQNESTFRFGYAEKSTRDKNLASEQILPQGKSAETEDTCEKSPGQSQKLGQSPDGKSMKNIDNTDMLAMKSPAAIPRPPTSPPPPPPPGLLEDTLSSLTHLEETISRICETMAGNSEAEAEKEEDRGAENSVSCSKSTQAESITAASKSRSLEPIYEALVLQHGELGREVVCPGGGERAGGPGPSAGVPSPPARQLLLRRDSKGGLSPRLTRRQPTVRRYRNPVDPSCVYTVRKVLKDFAVCD